MCVCTLSFKSRINLSFSTITKKRVVFYKANYYLVQVSTKQITKKKKKRNCIAWKSKSIVSAKCQNKTQQAMLWISYKCMNLAIKMNWKSSTFNSIFERSKTKEKKFHFAINEHRILLFFETFIIFSKQWCSIERVYMQECL